MNQPNAIVVGSLSAMAKASNQSLAETFLSCDALILVDVSGSMAAEDAREGKSRYSVALEELATLQATMPGKLAIVGFSDKAEFCPGGVPVFMGAGTDLAGALRFAQVADVGGMRFVVVSDGAPNDAEAALRVASTYKGRIDTVFCGPEDDREGGRIFLNRLATAHGGQSMTVAKALNLAANMVQLLEAR